MKKAIDESLSRNRKSGGGGAGAGRTFLTSRVCRRGRAHTIEDRNAQRNTQMRISRFRKIREDTQSWLSQLLSVRLSEGVV